MNKRTHDWVAEWQAGYDGTAAGTPPLTEASCTLLRGCFELFFVSSTGLAKLSIETSNDLFEMDARVTLDDVYEFRSKRSEWLKAFESALRLCN